MRMICTTYLTKQDHFPKDQLAVYGIASPADHINGDWIAKIYQEMAREDPNFPKEFLPLDSYITSTHDFVINSARTVFYSNPAMSGNIDTPIGHNLVDVYLSDPKARAQITKMMSLEIFYLLVSQTFTAKGVHKMGLAMSSSIMNTSNTTLKDTNNNVACDISGCSSKILFATLDPQFYSGGVLYFPQKSFGHKSYKILRSSLAYNSVAIMLSDTLPDHENAIYCDFDYSVRAVYCRLSQYTNVQDAAYSSVSPSMREYWNLAQATFPQVFENGMFITNEFTVN